MENQSQREKNLEHDIETGVVPGSKCVNIPTLSPEVYEHCLHWAIGSLRGILNPQPNLRVSGKGFELQKLNRLQPQTF